MENAELLMLMPGLNVQILAPTVQQPPQSGTFEVTAWVRMMCGCKIAATGIWPEAQFAVSASVVDLQGNPVLTQSLTFDASTLSTFGSKITLAPGEYQLSVIAGQSSRSNWGSASMYVSVPSAPSPHS